MKLKSICPHAKYTFPTIMLAHTFLLAGKRPLGRHLHCSCLRAALKRASCMCIICNRMQTNTTWYMSWDLIGKNIEDNLAWKSMSRTSWGLVQGTGKLIHVVVQACSGSTEGRGRPFYAQGQPVPVGERFSKIQVCASLEVYALTFHT